MSEKRQDDSPAIEVTDLAKRYGTVCAVDGISFEVSRGEFFGFLGPNGAGKTTTVRVLTGVIKADAGSALIMGFESGSLTAKQAAGIVPEIANAYADLSGWQNLTLMSELYGVPRREARHRASRLLEQMQLLPRKDALARTYSKGMKQRLILCMALISDPDVLFLDEPTSGLDVQSARLIRGLLRELNGQGKTIFLTTHDMDEASELCHRVAIIRDGRIAAIDAPEKLRLATSTQHSIEVSFETTVPENMLASLPGVHTVKKTGDKYRLYTSAPGEAVVSLVETCRSCGLKIVSLNTLAPTLEDAFVALTGREEK
jgi:ABC-2 type transport system ATP-binding protein